MYFKSPWDDDNDSGIFKLNKKKSANGFKVPEFPEMPELNYKYIIYAACVLVFIWLVSGFYKVNEGEEAAVMRFGKYVRTAKPGLNYHLPYPVETVIIESVSLSRRAEIGYRSSQYNSQSPKSISNESKMLTGDENIIELNCDVLWHISDLEKFLFNLAHPEETVKASAESAIREVIGETPIVSALSSQKQEITRKVEVLLQKALDSYQSGITIEMVQLLKAEPPEEVISAYRDVQTSKADKQKEINQAIAYNNDILPKARGEAAKLIQAAEAYRQETISKAEGDSKRFVAIYSQYVNQKELTKNRLYLDSVEKILGESSKIIITNSVLPHLPLDKK
ncbi:MAG: FtsH protease activity modulator HflK [Rickettsiaceae bacterium]|nr:FtsH protease activity modulator HflK [Rickettsiaceae bacterium]